MEFSGVVKVFVAPVRTGHRPQYVTDGNLSANYAFFTVLEIRKDWREIQSVIT